jgi:hypothetical protein
MRQASISILALTLAAVPALAQVEEDAPPAERPDARLNPLLTDKSLDEQMLQRTTRPAGGISILPSERPGVEQVVPNQPVDAARLALADGSDAWTEEGSLRPEGTFLVGWTGEVVLLRTGGLAFLPVTQEGGRPEPAMALLPGGLYARLVNLLNGAERGLWVSLTGEVLEYHGRNYLMPTAFASAQEPEPVAVDVATEPGEDEPAIDPPEEQPEPADSRIDELVRELESQRTERRGIDTAFDTGTDGERGQVTPSGPRLDGKMLLSRRGRMVRNAEGGWVISIDNDAVATTAGDARSGGKRNGSARAGALRLAGTCIGTGRWCTCCRGCLCRCRRAR